MYALFIIDIASQIDQRPKVSNFLRDAEEATTHGEASSRICGNTWLIDLNNNLLLLRLLLDLADEYLLPYKISFSEIKPKFNP